MDEPQAKRARGEGAPTDPRIRPHAAPIAAASAAAVAIKQQSYGATSAAAAMPASSSSATSAAAFPLMASGFSASATSAQLSPAMQMQLLQQLQAQIKQLQDEKAELQLKREFWRDEESKQRQYATELKAAREKDRALIQSLRHGGGGADGAVKTESADPTPEQLEPLLAEIAKLKSDLAEANNASQLSANTTLMLQQNLAELAERHRVVQGELTGAQQTIQQLQAEVTRLQTQIIMHPPPPPPPQPQHAQQFPPPPPPPSSYASSFPAPPPHPSQSPWQSSTPVAAAAAATAASAHQPSYPRPPLLGHMPMPPPPPSPQRALPLPPPMHAQQPQQQQPQQTTMVPASDLHVLQGKYESLKLDYNALVDQYDEQKTELRSLSDRLASTKSHASRELEDLQKRVALTNEETKQAHRAKSAAENAVTHAQRALARERENSESLRAECLGLQKNLRALELSLDRANDAHKATEGRSNQLLSTTREQLEWVLAEKNQLAAQLEAMMNPNAIEDNKAAAAAAHLAAMPALPVVAATDSTTQPAHPLLPVKSPEEVARLAKLLASKQRDRFRDEDDPLSMGTPLHSDASEDEEEEEGEKKDARSAANGATAVRVDDLHPISPSLAPAPAPLPSSAAAAAAAAPAADEPEEGELDDPMLTAASSASAEVAAPPPSEPVANDSPISPARHESP